MATARVDTIVRGGQVVSASGITETAIAIRGEKIVATRPRRGAAARRARDRRHRQVRAARPDRLPRAPGAESTTTGAPGRSAPRPRRAHHAAAVRGVRRQHRETLPQAIKRLSDEAGQQSVLDFGFHFILNHQPTSSRAARGRRMGVRRFKIFMTYKKRPEAHVLRRLHRRGHGGLAALGGTLPAPLRERRRPSTWSRCRHRRRAHAPDRLPGHLPAVDRGGGDQPRHRDRRDSPAARCTWCTSARSSGWSASSARRPRASASGRRRARSTCS